MHNNFLRKRRKIVTEMAINAIKKNSKNILGIKL